MPGADLSISKTADLTRVKTGKKLTYTITVKNEGTADASDVVVEDALPAGGEGQSVRSAQGTCSPLKTKPDGTVTCNLGSLPSGASATVTIAIKVKVHGPATITNTATVSSSTPECNTANNSAFVTTSVFGRTDSPPCGGCI